MCKYSRGPILSIYILFSSKHDLRINRSETKSQVPLAPLLEKQNMQAKEGYWSPNGNPDFRIRETFACGIWNTGIFFRGIRNPWPWNSTIEVLNSLPGIRNPQRGIQNPYLSCSVFFVWLVQFNGVLQRLEITMFRARTPDRLFSSFVNRMTTFVWLVRTMFYFKELQI